MRKARTASMTWFVALTLAGLAGPVRGDARPLAFEENRGQIDPQVRFLSRGPGFTLFLTPSEAVLAPREGGRPLRLRWLGARPAPDIAAEVQLPGTSNYLRGDDPAKWRTGVPSWSRVRYRGVYPGIDLVFYGNPRQLEHDFIVAPGADPRALRLVLEGADRMAIDATGDLVLTLGARDVRLKKPLAYQEVDGNRREIASAFRLLRRGTERGTEVGFTLASYDRGKPLVIDPVLTYSTYLGGDQQDAVLGAVFDAAGNKYLTGLTSSTAFPGAAGPPASSVSSYDVFVTRLAADGQILSSTLIGGASNEWPCGIARDAAGAIYVAGTTDSPDFPRIASLLPRGETFVLKLDPTASTLLYSAPFVAGSPTGLAVDPQGHAYVLGRTFHPGLHAVNALFPTPPGGLDLFVAKMSLDGSEFVYSTYLGGSGRDFTGFTAVEVGGIVVDAAGNAYVTGTTDSSDFPQVSPALPQSSSPGTTDAVVVKLSPDGSRLLFSSRFGGSNSDMGQAIALDPSGNIVIYGLTRSADLPVRNALQPVGDPGPDGGGPYQSFLTRLALDGSILSSTYFGSTYNSPTALTIDPAGSIYLLGFITGVYPPPPFPLKDPLPVQMISTDEIQVSYVTHLNADASQILFSSYVPGTQDLEGWANAIAVDGAGNILLAGETSYRAIPIVNAPQGSMDGWDDAFVLQISPENHPPACAAAVASPALLWPPNGDLASVALQGVTDPDGDAVTLRVTSIRQDEPLSKNRQSDATGIGTAGARVRADRAGSGDGRVYHLAFTADDGRGGTCTGTVTICVPHDQGRKTCGDGGALFDSMGGQ